MAIKGKKRETKDFNVIRIGFAEVEVICVNPTREEYSEILGIELGEDSKSDNYVTVNDKGTKVIRIDFWLRDVKNDFRNKITYFIEKEVSVNKDNTRTQFINHIGKCTWASSESEVPEWFGTNFRKAYKGEEHFYTFCRFWLNKLDLRNGGELSFDLKKLFDGDFSEIKEQVNGEYAGTFLVLLEVRIDHDEEGNEKIYQSVYKKDFLFPADLKFFRLIDYDNPDVIMSLEKKDPKKMKRHELFVSRIKGPYGSKDLYLLKPAVPFDPSIIKVNENLTEEDDNRVPW